MCNFEIKENALVIDDQIFLTDWNDRDSKREWKKVSTLAKDSVVDLWEQEDETLCDFILYMKNKNAPTTLFSINVLKREDNKMKFTIKNVCRKYN